MAAKTDPAAGGKGITLFTVDCTLPGFTRGRNLEKIGHHAADTSELFLEGVTVPAGEVLGGLGKGFANLMNELPRERLILAIGALAACEGTIARTIAYVKERTAFGQPIAAFQNTRFKLAELEAQVRVNRAYIEACKDRSTTAASSRPSTRPSRSSRPPSCRARSRTSASSSSAGTATPPSTRSHATSSTHASSASTAARARS
jgi:alkylation response protein AidB-like acyl-CoA dehydrogenase